jgi:hypothetical protein
LYVRDATRLIREHRMNEAVRLVVEHTAVGLAEARIMVEDLAMRVRTGARTTAQASQVLGPSSAGATVVASSATRPAPPAAPSASAPWAADTATTTREYDIVGPAAGR